jgi:uncharacterized protein (DUF58 family)
MPQSSRYLEPALIEQLTQLQFAARSVVEGSATGLHRSQLKGASIEFRQHRAYVPGDEPRRLDWRVLARTDRPFIKEYDEETNLRCLLMLDCSGSMAYGRASATTLNKFEYAARLCASLAYLMLAATESVGMAALGEGLSQWLPPRSGSRQLSRITIGLDRAAPRGRIELKRSTEEAASRLGRRAVVILISDFFSPPTLIRDSLARLRHDRHELICLRILHPDELEFPFQTWSRFHGLEGERPALCEPAVMRAAYLANFDRHSRALRQAFQSVSAEFHQFVTDRPLIDSVTDFLRQRATR